MAVVGLDGRFKAVNRAFCDLLGYPESELLGRHPAEITHPDDQGRSFAVVSRLLRTEARTDQAHKRYLRRDGSAVDVVRTTTALRDADGRTAGLFTQVVDITAETRMRDLLARSDSRFKALVAHSSELTALIDDAGRIIYASPASRAILGWAPEEMEGRSPLEFIHPEEVDRARLALAGHMGPVRRSDPAHYRVVRRDGSWRDVEVVTTNLVDDPAVGAVVVNVEDVTVARRRAGQQQAVADLSGIALGCAPVEALLGRAPGIVAEMVGASHCAVLLLGEHGELSVVGSTGATAPEVLLTASTTCPVTAEALTECRPAMWAPSGSDAGRGRPLAALGIAFAAAIPVVGATGPVGAITLYSSQGGALSADDVSFVETVANVLAAALTRRDFEAELRHQAVHDQLTGLPNRALLMDRLAAALDRLPSHPEPAREVALVFVDLDDFKLLNDTLGHSQGDVVLAAVAERLRDAAGSTATVARFGGDEFVVVAEGADEASAKRLAAGIGEAIRAPIQLDATAVALSASIGVVLTSDPAVSAETVLADADLAMYEAKRAGKKQAAVYDPEMRRRLTVQMETVSGIRRALVEDEFRLFYQPIVEVASGRVMGHEALVRWQHPTEGLVGPDRFIGHAESSGLIIALGEWVLRTACRQAAAWRRAGAVSKVSINVSALQLSNGDLAELVADVLQLSGAEPSDIALEVTESAVMADLDRACETLEALRRLGVLISMDDFGTGWSSLSQLTRLPFDAVKIDRSFVRDLLVDARATHLLESIVALGRALRLHVIAEGVETPEQLEHLERLGVGFAQGFLLGRPAPA